MSKYLKFNHINKNIKTKCQDQYFSIFKTH